MPGHHNAIGNTAAVDEHHFITGLDSVYLHADTAHHTASLHADLVAERRTLIGQFRQQPERHHDVAEVECRGNDINLHIVRFQLWQIVSLHLETGYLPGKLQEEPVGRVFPGRYVREEFPLAHNPRHPQPASAHGEFAIAEIVPGEPGQRLKIIGGTKVH